MIVFPGSGQDIPCTAEVEQVAATVLRDPAYPEGLPWIQGAETVAAAAGSSRLHTEGPSWLPHTQTVRRTYLVTYLKIVLFSPP